MTRGGLALLSLVARLATTSAGCGPWARRLTCWSQACWRATKTGRDSESSGWDRVAWGIRGLLLGGLENLYSHCPGARSPAVV